MATAPAIKQLAPETFAERATRIEDEVGRVIVGQRELVRQTLTCLLANGHALLEGVPGLGKTLLVKALAQTLGLSFRRIQFTPDLMPSDVTGSSVYNAKVSEFNFVPGPIFAQLVLADEINRAPAKTQSSLLEAMQDRSVSSDGVTRSLPQPFLVIATQNPVESQGTYPLPEAQLDRFLLKLEIGYPGKAAELTLLKNYVAGFDSNKLEGFAQLLDEQHVLAMQDAVTEVRVADEILEYITTIVDKSRSFPAVALGASPRASIGLLAVARAQALLRGRDFVVPDDVKSHAHGVLRHRLVLQPDAELEGTSADVCVDSILREVPVPKTVA
jgi:MoxR-like ATPase